MSMPTPYVLGGIEGWDVDDPASQSLEKVREIRDDIERRARDRRSRGAPGRVRDLRSSPTRRPCACYIAIAS
jgi:hypothetical protein